MRTKHCGFKKNRNLYMKSNTNICRLFFVFLLFSIKSFGQNANPILSMDIDIVPIGNNFSLDSLPMISDSTIYQVGMNLNLYDSTDIQNIEVKLGSTDGGSEFMSHVFAFDVSGSLGGGLSYVRNGNSIQLGLGELTGVYSYFAEVRVQHLNGTYSPFISFNK